MSWEQHRYAVERARDRMKSAAESINDHCAECGLSTETIEDCMGICNCPDGKPIYAGVTLQGEAASSDAEMLDDVADFLKALDGYQGDKAQIGNLQGSEAAAAYAAEWNKVVTTLSVFCDRYSIPKPLVVFHPRGLALMRLLSGEDILSVLIYAGVKVTFGIPENMTVIRP